MCCILTLSSVRVVGTLECLPSNPSFDKQISGRKKGGGVRVWDNGYQQVCCSTLNWGLLDRASRGPQLRVLKPIRLQVSWHSSL